MKKKLYPNADDKPTPEYTPPRDTMSPEIMEEFIHDKSYKGDGYYAWLCFNNID